MSPNPILPEAAEEPKNPERSFGLVFTIVFLAIGFYPLVGGGGLRIWALVIAGALLLISFVVPVLLRPFNWVWMKFGLVLHFIMTPVIMLAIFVLTVIPTGLLMKLFGKDPLSRKFEPDKESYWVLRDPAGPEPESLKDQF